MLTAVKTSVLIFTIFWVRVTVPRLRIDQLMSFSWKVLIPLSFAQILVNGLILVYDWPDILLLVTSGFGVVALFTIIDRSVRRPRPRPVLTRKRSRRRGGNFMRGILRSMATTLSTFARRPVTREYPTVHRPIPERDRAFPLLLWTARWTSRSAPAATPVSAPARWSA